MPIVGRKFRSVQLRNPSPEVPPLWLNPSELPPREAIPISAAYGRMTTGKVCEACKPVLMLADYESPPGVAEATIHFNETQTAIINTASEAVAIILGETEFRENRAATIIAVLRTFLDLNPDVMATVRDTRAARIERGATSRGEQPGRLAVKGWEAVATHIDEPKPLTDSPTVAAPVEPADIARDELPDASEMTQELPDAGGMYDE